MTLSSSNRASARAGQTRVWTAFHLNLMFSSIEEESRPTVIERCYWPLLRAVEATGFPVGIELTGYTLATIHRLDPAWIEKLRGLSDAGLVEPIASGEAQLIGPLAPAVVNAANLRLGNLTYERLLGRRPKLVLVNEQCFSRSMVDHYIDAGYDGFITDWDNVHLAHPDWDPGLRYAPLLAAGSAGRALPVLWSLTVAFQKLQRLAHGVEDRAAYRRWLDRQLDQNVPALNLYCNDGEIFDFRPGRFEAEPTPSANSEWHVIESLFGELRRDPRVLCCLPSDILASLPPEPATPLPLTTAAMPLPTKKQEKYNVLRWAATGRDDLGINARCLALAHRLRDSLSASDEDWRELCHLYSSDFRTHVTLRRWAAYRERLAAFERRWNQSAAAPAGRAAPSAYASTAIRPDADGIIRLDTGAIGIELNAKRGLAVHRLWQGDRTADWLVGTIPFGYYDDIRLGADFYTSHLVFQQPGKAQVTDLSPVEASLATEANWLSIRAKLKTALGPVEKELRLHRDASRLDLFYRLDWPVQPLGVLRLGHVTANPEAFDADTMWYETHNGGTAPERFALNGTDFDHGRPVSHLVSASTALGMTEDAISFGDARRHVTIAVAREQTAAVPMVVWRRLKQGFFFRIAFSAGEIDDTIKVGDPSRAEHWPMAIGFSLTLDAAA
jgi:Glycosyl hydrolase family 57